MRTARIVLGAAVLAAAAPASAQLSTRSVALEPGISTPPGGRGGALPALALSASAWLEGDAEAVVRVALRSAAETEGHGASRAICATAGLRLSTGPDALRPQLQLEIGWQRAERAQRLAIGAGVGLEWFPARDLSLAARLALRGDPAALRLEASLAAAAYF